MQFKLHFSEQAINLFLQITTVKWNISFSGNIKNIVMGGEFHWFTKSNLCSMYKLQQMKKNNDFFPVFDLAFSPYCMCLSNILTIIVSFLLNSEFKESIFNQRTCHITLQKYNRKKRRNRWWLEIAQEKSNAN